MTESVKSSTPEPFRVEVHDAGDHTVIAPVGELDVATSAQLRERVGELDGVRRLVLDLRGIDFMDSSALKLLFTLNAHGQDGGPPLEVIESEARVVQRLFELTGARTILTVVEP